MLSQGKANTRSTKPELSTEKKQQLRLKREKVLRLLTLDKLQNLPLPGELTVDEPMRCLWHDDETPSMKGWVAPEGYPIWKCYTCNRAFSGIDVVGLAYGLDGRAAWRKALELVGGRVALDGVKITAEDLRTNLDRSAPRWPPRHEVRLVLNHPRPAYAAGWFEERGLSLDFAVEHGLCFSSGSTEDLHFYWKGGRYGWEWRGYQLLFPSLSADGQRVSVRARQTGLHRTTSERGSQKVLAPSRYTCAGTVLANAAAWRLLLPPLTEAERELIPYFFPGASAEASPLPTVVEIAEGEPDFLRRCESAAPGTAVFGIFSGAWTQAHADRIPDGVTVKLYTHSDPAGMEYQHQIAESLKDRCTILVRHQRTKLVDRYVFGKYSLRPKKGIKLPDETEIFQKHGRSAYEAVEGDMMPYLGREEGPAEELPQPHAYTDLGNAKRLIDRHGQDIHYVPAWGRWLIWDGCRWEPDELGKIDLLVSDTVEQIPFEEPHSPEQLPEPAEPAGGAAADLARAKAEVARVAAERAAAAHAAVSAAATPAAKLRAEAAAASATAKSVAARLAADKAAAKAQPAAAQDGEAARAALMAWAYESQAGPRMREVARVAQARVAVSPGQLDSDPWLINTKSGVVDLRTGKLRPNSRDLMQTRICPVEYFEGASPRHLAPKWHAFLNEATEGNEELIRFLQRYAGYSLTGSAREQKLVVLLGPGGSGKGTLINTLQHILGSYARSVPRAVVADRRPDEHSTDLSDLEGARMAIVSELRRGSHLATDTVKLITSTDTLPARRMHENNRNFSPTHKLWVMSQYLPRIDADDSGIWRRVLVVPFAAKPKAINENLEKELMNEATGIIAWALQGCLEWQRIGLRPPECVLAKTAEMRAEKDILGAFFDEVCVQGSGVGDTEKGALYAAYAEWCAQSGVRGVLPKNEFGSALEVRGLKSRKSGPSRYWCDLMLVRSLDPLPRGTLSPRDQSELLNSLAVLPLKAKA